MRKKFVVYGLVECIAEQRVYLYVVYSIKIKITEVFPFIFKKYEQIPSSPRVPSR